MTKKLLVQIKNEWRNNLWLALELLVVSVVMWFVVDYLYTRAATYLEPRGFDISHCYLIEMGKLTDKSSDYIPNQTDEQEDADILELVDRLRRRPEIEAVSLSQNSYPYNGSNSTDMVRYDTLVSDSWTIRRMVTPDFVRVFRYQGTRGETPEQLAGMLEKGADILELVDRLRRRPEIEAVSLSQNSYPYNGSNSTDMVRYDTLVSDSWTIRRMVTPDFVRVFRYQGTRGETPEQLAGMLEKGEFLASDNLYRKYGRPLTELVGKRCQLFGDTTQTYRLGAALKDVRYNDFQQARSSYTFLYKLDWYDIGLELCLRVRANQDHDFIRRLKADSEKQFRIGNVYISEVRSFKDIRRNFQQSWSNDLRNYVMGMGFLLLNIFLGLLGTFWFRTQQRRSEIALHKAHGASDMSIFVRLISEGLLLLLLITPIAFIIDYNLASMELNSWRNGTTLEWGRLLLCAAVSFVLIGLMITIGIGIPARKAMKVQPAEALHDE